MKSLSARFAVARSVPRFRSISVNGVIVRSEMGPGRAESAWVSLLVVDNEPALVNEFKATEWGEEAWAQAVKYGKRLAERLGDVTIQKRRAKDLG